MGWVDDFAWVEQQTALGPTNLNKLNKGIRTIKNGVYNVQDYGAVGDSVTDDTAAIQSAVSACVAAPNARVYFPKGTYKITAAISVPVGQRFTIEGASAGTVTISQATNNTPIFTFAQNLTNGWVIRGISFTYATAQPSTSTAACPIYFQGGSGSMFNFYNWTVQGCDFSNCCYCMGSDSTKQNDIWGGTMRDCLVEATVSGGVASFQSSVSVGQPNNSFEHIYIRADVMVGPIFKINSGTNTWLTGIEINQSLLGPLIISDSGGGSYAIGTLKTEVGSYTSTGGGGGCLFTLPNGSLKVSYLLLQTLTITTASMTRPYIFNLAGGAANGVITVDHLDIAGATITGTYFLTNASAASNVGNVKVGSFTRALPANFVLTDNVGTASADVVQVLDWNKGSVSADQGDNSVTVVPGTTPNILSFETALTAARTVTLPSATSAVSQVFNGLRYRVCRTGAGAFALNINNGAVLLDSIPSGNTGVIEYVYRHSAWVQTVKSLH